MATPRLSASGELFVDEVEDREDAVSKAHDEGKVLLRELACVEENLDLTQR
jgi:hypothetical protein